MKKLVQYGIVSILSISILAACGSKTTPVAEPTTTATESLETVEPTTEATESLETVEPSASSEVSPSETATDVTYFTTEELSKFDGKNGNPTYIAIDGIVYDVTNLKPWKNGEHNGYPAGKDLSTEILQSPHGKSYLKNATPVGELKN